MQKTFQRSPTAPFLIETLIDPDTGEMTLSSIRHFVLGRDSDERRRLQEVDSFLRKELEGSDRGSEKRLVALFYALIVKSRIFSMETPEMHKLFSAFTEEMEYQISAITRGYPSETAMENIRKRGISGYFQSLFQTIDFRLKLLENKVQANQMRAFLSLCEYYIHCLETVYKDLSMSERVLGLYVIRMDIKKSLFFFERRFSAWFGMAFFRDISSYGTSFGRLAVTCILSIALFGSVYWLADFLATPDLRMIQDLGDYSSYLFNSLVTITGLGIDAHPETALQRIAMGINATYGMVVFGMLFNVISTKLSMNS